MGAINSINQRPNFSNYGTQVAIYAPGDNILSTTPVSLCNSICHKTGTLTDNERNYQNTDSSAWYDYYNNIVPMANSIIIEDLYPNSYIESNVWNGTDFWFSESLVDIYYYDYPDITYSEIFFYLGDNMDGYYFTMNDIEELTLYVNCDNYYDPDSGFELYNEDWDYITRCGIEEDYFVISLMDLLDYYDENTGLLHFYMYPEEDTLDCIWFYVQEIEIYIELSGAN